MNRRTMPTLATMALLCFTIALPAGDAAAQQKSLKDQLVGTWTLVSVEDINPNGTKKQYHGANPRGILMLDAGGRYAWVEGPSDRPKLKGSRADATAEEFHAAAYLLHLNGIIGEADVIDAQTLPKVQMPNRDNFIRIYPREP
jgi:hypothetical protein